MRLLSWETQPGGSGRWKLSTFDDSKSPFYAILSHTWGPDGDEVTFDDITQQSQSDTWMDKPGYDKLKFMRWICDESGLRYFWIDSCCIQKSSSAELQESLNSMYRWYETAAICCVYLSDIRTPNPFTTKEQRLAFSRAEMHKSRWFTRGWTLQELIGPSHVKFYANNWKFLGTRYELSNYLSHVTGVPEAVFEFRMLHLYCTKTRISWAANRKTKRQEDKAYCLQGLCGVHLPVMYGVGGKLAMDRLYREIKDMKVDHHVGTFGCLCCSPKATRGFPGDVFAVFGGRSSPNTTAPRLNPRLPGTTRGYGDPKRSGIQFLGNYFSGKA